MTLRQEKKQPCAFPTLLLSNHLTSLTMIRKVESNARDIQNDTTLAYNSWGDLQLATWQVMAQSCAILFVPSITQK